MDCLDLARQWRPALTTVHVPTEAMWTQAADYLLARLDGSLAVPQQREIAVDLVVRGSTGPAPAAPGLRTTAQPRPAARRDR